MPERTYEYADDPLGLGRPPRTLVVDDDDDTRDMLATLLGSFGWTVTAARSAEEALALFDATAIDLVLADIGLPDMDGCELLGHLRVRARRRIPAVAITGHGNPDDVERPAEAGFDGHLTKPFQLASLLAMLRKIASSE
jgi:CheY-like chemotaxis protein